MGETQPQRIQLSRRKGFNLQLESRALNGLEAVNCARPSRWGNPFAVRRDPLKRGWAVVYEDLSRWESFDLRSDAVARAIVLHRHVLDVVLTPDRVAFLKDALCGRNLACWCELSDLCHVDDLLRVAAT